MLVVDDDLFLLKAFRDFFTRNGYVVHVAATALAGKSLAAKHRPDVAVVDLRIGRDWGVDVIDDLKSLNKSIHVVLLSGFVSVATAVDAIHAGAADVIFKPIALTELLQRIERGTPKADRRNERPPTLARANYEHMSRVLADANGNVSEAARRLGVHRNTLQRMLRKVPRD